MSFVPAPAPANEAERLRTLHAFNILDTDPESLFDDLALSVARICGYANGADMRGR